MKKYYKVFVVLSLLLFTATMFAQAPSVLRKNTITPTQGQNVPNLNSGNKYTSQDCIQPPSGMVAWWSLDETSGTTSLDLALFNNAGTQVNGPLPVAGKVLGGLQFDGINDYIQVPDHYELNLGTDNFSIDAWVKVQANESTGQLTIVNKIQFPLNRGYSLYLSNGEVRLILSASSYMFYVSSVHVADGDWHHIAVTVDRTDPNGIKFYKDGIMLSSSDPTTNPGTITAISPLRIGTLSFTVGDMFKGLLDEIELFNRVLTSQEVNSIYSAGSAGKCKLSTISGMKYNDINGNGSKDIGDLGLANWTITLEYLNGAGTIVTQTATTDANGSYCFTNLTANTYSLSETPQGGWTQTAPATPGTYTIVLTAGQNSINNDFGNQPITGCVDPPYGMVAWYPLDETLGATVVKDIIGTNDGSPQPGPVGIMGSASSGPIPGSTLSFLQPPFMVDGSLYFWAGVNTKYVRVPNNATLNFGSGDFSIDAWVYPVLGSNYVQPIVEKSVTTLTVCVGYRLFILNGQLNFVVMDGSNTSVTLAPITYSQWQHVVAVRKGGNPNTILLYINGTLINTSTPQINNISNTTDLLIGGISSPSGGIPCGLPAVFNFGEIAIDELEIFSRAITPAEIFSIWNARTFGKCKPYIPTGVKKTEVIPQKFELLQSYPNPFNPTATIQYDIPNNSFVNINVYDMLGREVKVLVNEQKNPGRYQITFDASELSSGIYFYTIRTKDFTQSKKMILMK